LLDDVRVENENKVAAMSSLERQREIEELQEAFSPGILEMLAQRAQRKARMAEGMAGAQVVARKEASSEGPKERGVELVQAPVVSAGTDVQAAAETDRTTTLNEAVGKYRSCIKLFVQVLTRSLSAGESQNRRKVHFSATEALLPSEIQKQYFPEEDPNNANLQWLQESQATSSTTSASLRFDLSGKPLTSEQAADLPSHLGLHHHGDEAGQAGYTIKEILMLCASSFGPQRTIMVSLLGKIASQLDSYPERVKKELVREKVRQSCLEITTQILASGDKNSGLLRETIACLYAAIKADQFEHVDDTEAVHTVVEDSQIQNWIQKAPIEDMMARVKYLLSSKPSQSVLSTVSIRQLLAVLLAMSHASFDAADSIAKIVSTLVKSFVSSLDWPVPTAEMENASIAVQTLRISLVCTMTSRTGAKSQLKASCYDQYLRFLAVPPWRADAAASAKGIMYRIAGHVVRTFETVARYGLNGSLLSSAPELWLSVGRWATRLDVSAATEELALASAYFDLLRVWIVSATDPHSMEKEHDLVWTQVEGLGWADEALSVLQSELVRDERKSASRSSRDLAVSKVEQSAIDLLVAWAEGVTKNTPRSGADEKEAIKEGLPTDFVEATRKQLEELPTMTGHSASTRDLQARAAVAESRLSLCGKLGIDVFPDEQAVLACVKSLSTIPSDVHPVRCLRYTLLQSFPGAKAITDISTWAGLALQAILKGQPGDETSLLNIVDLLLDLPWNSDRVVSISHSHGLYILRPFLHYAILPDLDVLVGPSRPLSNMLRVTTTLRRGTVARNIRTGAIAGLPLVQDWLFTPFNALLKRRSSPVFKQLPPAWNASRLQLLRATLVFADLLLHPSEAQSTETDDGQGLTRSQALVNLMKVFVLEQVDPADDEETVESELFRDSVVQENMTRFLAPVLQPSSQPLAKTTTMSDVATSFLGAATTFYQFYYDFIELYESISLGHKLFSQLVLPPLAHAYPLDYRKLVWCEQPSVLRTLRMQFDDVPREHGTLETYFEPVEDDEDVLLGYARALVGETVHPRTHPFLYNVAAHHVAGAVWAADGTLVEAQKTVWDLIKGSEREELVEDLCWRRTDTDGLDREGSERVFRGQVRVEEEVYQKRKMAQAQSL
jgi:hypothetical protein